MEKQAFSTEKQDSTITSNQSPINEDQNAFSEKQQPPPSPEPGQETVISILTSSSLIHDSKGLSYIAFRPDSTGTLVLRSPTSNPPYPILALPFKWATPGTQKSLLTTPLNELPPHSRYQNRASLTQTGWLIQRTGVKVLAEIEIELVIRDAVAAGFEGELGRGGEGCRKRVNGDLLRPSAFGGRLFWVRIEEGRFCFTQPVGSGMKGWFWYTWLSGIGYWGGKRPMYMRRVIIEAADYTGEDGKTIDRGDVWAWREARKRARGVGNGGGIFPAEGAWKRHVGDNEKLRSWAWTGFLVKGSEVKRKGWW